MAMESHKKKTMVLKFNLLEDGSHVSTWRNLIPNRRNNKMDGHVEGKRNSRNESQSRCISGRDRTGCSYQLSK